MWRTKQLHALAWWETGLGPWPCLSLTIVLYTRWQTALELKGDAKSSLLYDMRINSSKKRVNDQKLYWLSRSLLHDPKQLIGWINPHQCQSNCRNVFRCNVFPLAPLPTPTYSVGLKEEPMCLGAEWHTFSKQLQTKICDYISALFINIWRALLFWNCGHWLGCDHFLLQCNLYTCKFFTCSI